MQNIKDRMNNNNRKKNSRNQNRRHAPVMRTLQRQLNKQRTRFSSVTKISPDYSQPALVNVQQQPHDAL